MSPVHEEPFSAPVEAPHGPVVAITDEYASSGGDIVVQALHSRGIATVVDTRTWGGTPGVDLKYVLVDGTLVAQPKYALWFADVGWAVENHGVDPDVEVAIAPTTGPRAVIPSSTPPSGWRCGRWSGVRPPLRPPVAPPAV